jgi:hypothetical protein
MDKRPEAGASSTHKSKPMCNSLHMTPALPIAVRLAPTSVGEPRGDYSRHAHAWVTATMSAKLTSFMPMLVGLARELNVPHRFVASVDFNQTASSRGAV